MSEESILGENTVPCTIACDYCGAKPAFWFGRTSVALCGKEECSKRNQENWEEHCRRIESESEPD